jgi:hypothetical protein
MRAPKRLRKAPAKTLADVLAMVDSDVAKIVAEIKADYDRPKRTRVRPRREHAHAA